MISLLGSSKLDMLLELLILNSQKSYYIIMASMKSTLDPHLASRQPDMLLLSGSRTYHLK